MRFPVTPSTTIARFRHRVAPVAAVAVLAAACGAGAVTDRGTAPAPSIAINPDTEAMTDDMTETEDLAEPLVVPLGGETVGGDPSPAREVARARCLEAPPYLEAADAVRPEEEDDQPELSEEELERTYAPEFPTVDGVASPDERPSIDPMGAYDPSTATWEQLDRLIAFCIENDVVSEAELWGDEDEGEGDEDGWCEELASLAEDDIRAFAADDGEDIVREEFEGCGLPNPLAS